MRLLERKADDALVLHDFSGKDVPAYAILSHTWHTDNKQEVNFCAKQAAADGLR
jgi:hypothetical protein